MCEQNRQNSLKIMCSVTPVVSLYLKCLKSLYILLQLHFSFSRGLNASMFIGEESCPDVAARTQKEICHSVF